VDNFTICVWAVRSGKLLATLRVPAPYALLDPKLNIPDYVLWYGLDESTTKPRVIVEMASRKLAYFDIKGKRTIRWLPQLTGKSSTRYGHFIRNGYYIQYANDGRTVYTVNLDTGKKIGAKLPFSTSTYYYDDTPLISFSEDARTLVTFTLGSVTHSVLIARLGRKGYSAFGPMDTAIVFQRLEDERDCLE
jgi:hypothetical protein